MKRESMKGDKNPKYKHGGKGTRIYNIWKGMRRRCNPIHKERYPTYAGSGLTVSEEWMNSFELFRDWSLSNGYKDNLSIDRINTLKGYLKENCRWTTDLVQNRNAKTNRIFVIDGVSLTMSEVCEKYNISQSKLSARVNRLGWPIEKAILNINSKRGVNKHG
jgi:hypothetical protein